MTRPAKGSRDFQLRVTTEGGTVIEEEAKRLDVEYNDVIRAALTDYFAKQGKMIQFVPNKPGGARPRVTEQRAVERVLRHIRALGLPEPERDHKVIQKVFDLAWPGQQVAVEISQRKRPADKTGWTVAWIKPTMSDSAIDKVLKELFPAP